MIKLRLPDKMIVEAEFSPAETVGAVASLLQALLIHPNTPLELCTSLLHCEGRAAAKNRANWWLPPPPPDYSQSAIAAEGLQ